jgi:phage repressor protein C with HTH and peptisase S24 domain
MSSRRVRVGEFGGKEIGGAKVDARSLGALHDVRLGLIGDCSPRAPALHSGDRLADDGSHGADTAKLFDDEINMVHTHECSLFADDLSTAKCGRTGAGDLAHYADMTNEHVALRVKRIREGLGLSVRAAAAEMGMKPSSYGHYEDPKRLKGPLLPMSFAKEFADVAARFGGTPEDVLSLAGVHDGASVATEPPSDLVAVYDIEVSAGNGAIPVDFESQVGQLAFPPGYLRHITSAPIQQLAIVTVKGDSMSPTLREGDVVMIDTTKRNLGYDGLFVLRMDGALHVKRVNRGGRAGVVRILSDNRDSYPPTERDLSEVEAVGKVLWYGRKE